MLQRPKFTPPSDAVVVESESNFVPPSDAVVLKKKESTESTSTIQENNGDSVQEIGSSGTVGSNGFPAIDKNLGVPGLKPDLKTVEQLANPPKSKSTIQAEQNNALKYEKFKQFSTLPDEIKKENAQKVEDEANGVGFLNNVVSLGKNAYNTALEGMSNTPMMAGLKQLKVNTEPLADEKKEAKDLMIRQGVKPKDINSTTVLELAKKIKLQKLNDSDVESRKKEFLSDTDIDFEDLKKGANVELSKISNKDKELLKQKAILEPALKDSDDRLNQLNQQLANFKKNNQQPTPEFVDEYNYAIKYHNDILKDVQKTDNQFADNRDKIGDLKTNLDLFKRQYGKVNNFVSNIGATALDLAAGGFGIVDYGFNAAYGALGIDTGPKENSEIVTGLRGASKNIRDRIAKPINIDNIEDAGDFGDWMANTVIANQVPIYGLIATGPGGILALGGSSLGTKYGDMVQEMNPDNPVTGQILKNYSDAELAWKPVGFGIAETASALVDAHIMKGAARVLASATQPERRLISQTIAKRLLNVGKETIKGGATEAVDEMATQGVENIIDGKPFTEGMKDAGGAGGAMGLLIPFFAGNIAIATKSFSIDNKIQNSAKKTLALEKELANPNLSDEAKKIIKTNFEESKKTTENLLKKQVKDISKMSNEDFQEILKIENEQAKLKEKAVEIKTQEGLSDGIKKQLLSDFSDNFNKIEIDRVDILSGKKTMPKIEEVNEKPQEIAVTETKLQTEVPQQSEAEKVDIEKTKYRIAELNNEIEQNRIRGEKGEISNRSNKEIKAEIAELESKLPKENITTPVDSELENKKAEKVEIKNEGKSDAPTKENIDERLRINHPFYEKVSDALDKLGIISKYNPETKEGDVVGGYTQPTSDGGFSVGNFIFSKDGSISFFKDGARVEFDKNGNVISENTKEVAQEKNKIEIEGIKESITNLEKTRDNEAFKYKEATETDVLGNRKKVKRLKTAQELKESTDKINAAINKAKSRLAELEQSKPQEVSPVEDVVAPSVEGKDKVKEHISTLANDNYLFTHVTTEDNARNITENGMSVSLGTGISSTLTASGQESATNQAERLMNGEVVHRDLNNNSVAIISVPKAELDKMSGKSLAEKFENWLVENNHINDKGELAIPKELNAGYLSGQNFITNEKSQKSNPSSNGNVQSGTSNVGESRVPEQQSPAKESVPSAVDVGKSEIANEVDYALNQIDKGILQWNGDINSPRIDLGISWADIRKGEADLRRGKVDSAPAKRLIEAISKSKKEGGYHYKYGTGGESQRGREFVSLEDVQKATNEIPLTDAELEQVNIEEEQLAKEYENYFNSITEQEQTEIRENYENRPTVEQGVSTKTTEIGEGKNDVSNEKTPSRKEKRIKAVEASIDDLANALKDLLPSAPDTEGLRKQGLSQDDLIDFIAKNAKLLASATITIDEAIRQVIEHLKSKGFDLDVDEKLVKEKLGVEKPKSKTKNPLREKSSEEIADELGISEKDYLDLKAFVANEPSSGIFNEYLSADTIADVFGDGPTNDQQYEQMVLLNAVQHGNSVLEKARSIFGENYMSKTLEFLQNVKLGNFEKAMVYAALENEIDTLVKSNPSNKVFLATQRLIYADSQANLRNSSKGLNAGRLRRIHNAIKNGYDIDKLTIGLIKPEQQEAKQILKEAIPTGDNLNKASEQEENTEIEKPRVYTQEEFEAELKKAVQASVGKSRNELSKKGKDIADKIRRLKLNKDIAKSDLSLGAYDLAIEAIAQLVEKGSTVAQAIKNVLSDVKYKDIDADKLRQDILGVVNTPRIKDVVKQALIDAGFSREITVTKNAKDENGNDIIEDGKKVKIKETKEVLDWNKLTGRMNSVEALKANVEGKLKEQGYTDSQIEEISNELESEYKRLTEYIADKALTELERRNQIPKPVNRKSDLDRLVDYHNKGLFGESAKGYERLINKIVGITKREQEVLDKIESEIEKIKNLREVKIDGSFPDAQSIESQASYIAKSIRNIIAWSNLVNSPLKLQIITVLSDIAGISRAAVLGNLYNAFQNIYSNNRAGFLARMKFKSKGYWTPELNDAFNELKNTVTSDVLLNRGLDFGDTVSPFSNHSIFIEKIKDYINKKYPEGVKKQRAIGALNTFEGRLFLNVMDSRFKSKIVNIDFVMNLVDVLTSERAGKSKMTKEEAVNFVSESLTGVNLEKAKVLAKKFIDDVNAMKEGTLLKNEDNIKRLAFDIVRENLTSGNNFTMDEINDIYQASMKSGGINIGHESNNIVSEELKSLNNRIEKKVEDAMKEKDFDKATKYATYAFISKNILYPYMSGGLNWAVLEAEAGTPLGLATGAYKSYKNKNIDLLTDVGKKRMKEDLINKRDAESKLFRGIWGTSIAISAYLAYYGLQAVSGIGDDDEENKRIFNKYLREHPEQRKIFDKFSPEVYAVSLAVSDERLSKYLLNKMGYKTDQNDNVLTLLKSLQNKNSSTPGALGVLLGQIVSTPGAWRILRDSKRLFRELQGEPMAQTEQRVTSFLNGYFKGALVDYLGLRPGTNYDLEKVKKEIQNKKTDFTNYTNGIANDINSGKITKEDAAKLVNKKYEDNDELLDKAKEIIQNSVNDKEIREGLKDADIWYMEMHNEKDIRAKAYIYYQNELKNNASKTDKNFDKYMDIALYGIDEDYYKKFIDLAIEYKDVEEQKSKKKPIN